ncbi:HET-domain-containing protein [Pilatotrama ljubarskyi]|nr:HET-domain-containing protein [Pilatotrama ljubarskyi]
MWLLSTDRAELHFFAGPEAVPEGGYAILSHVWVTGEEQTFQDLQAIRSRCAQSGENPRDLVCSKIKECCILAERHGFKWAWIDTCCIDKTSSSELSEAINAMFRYYALAEVCYAYLRDVPSDCNLQEPHSAFRNSRWHTRGWTLQELLAPALVLFMSSEWKLLGTKMELAPLLQEITGVHTVVLRLVRPIEEVGVAQRMSWAAHRRTTRLEDEAYCLLGIFGISMPTLYGEGRQAFRRLQEEIIRRSIDTSIFAWGLCKPDGELSDTPPFPLSAMHDSTANASHQSFLLAPAPSAFREGKFIYYIPDTEEQHEYLGAKGERKGAPIADGEGKSTKAEATEPVGIPSFSLTAYGMQAHIPVIEEYGLTIAVLFCFQDGEQLGLLLHPCDECPDPTRPLYHTSYSFDSTNVCDCHMPEGFMDTYRLIPIGGMLDNLRLDGKPVTAEWRDIFLELRPTPIAQHVEINRSLDSPFRVPQWVIMKLRANWGFELYTSGFGLSARAGWRGARPQLIDFKQLETGEAFGIWMGCCDGRPKASSSSRSGSGSESEFESGASCNGSHNSDSEPEPELPLKDQGPAIPWAFAFLIDYGAPMAPPKHQCPADHISEWPSGARTFGDEERSVQLTFRRCGMHPGGSHVMDIGLGGHLFIEIEELQANMQLIEPERRFRHLRVHYPASPTGTGRRGGTADSGWETVSGSESGSHSGSMAGGARRSSTRQDSASPRHTAVPYDYGLPSTTEPESMESVPEEPEEPAPLVALRKSTALGARSANPLRPWRSRTLQSQRRATQLHLARSMSVLVPPTRRHTFHAPSAAAGSSAPARQPLKLV